MFRKLMGIVEKVIAVAPEFEFGDRYLNNEAMRAAPVREGKILCDLHTHPSNRRSAEELILTLKSPGLVGLSQRYNSTTILTYEEACDLVGKHSDFQELTRGGLARIGSGYFARTQEVNAGIHHLLAVGWNGSYFPDFEDAGEAVREIQRRNGVVILNHPYVVQGGLGFRMASWSEEARIKRLCDSVDEIEVHNAYCIDLVPSIVAMKRANVLADHLLEDFPKFKGVAASDCHRQLNQLKVCGIYFPEEELQTMDDLKDCIRNGNFERYGDSVLGPYVSRMSWLRGMVQEVDSDGYYTRT